MNVIREAYTDLAPEDWAAVEAGGYDTCQAKFDGWFVNIVFAGRQASVISREGSLLDILPLKRAMPPTVLLAEYLSRKRPQGMVTARVKKRTYIVFAGFCGPRMLIEAEMWDASQELMAPASAAMTERFQSIEKAKFWWDLWVRDRGHEGLIFRNSAEPWGKCARMVNPGYEPFPR
jgi:hypothetical protein